MSEALTIQVNGQSKTIPGVAAPTTLHVLIAELGLKADRIAVEHNGEIAPRSTWTAVTIAQNDRLEIVHFVGGGTPQA